MAPEAEGEGTRINVLAESCQVGTADLIWAAGLAKSKGEAKRLLSQSAVEVDQDRYAAAAVELRDGTIIKVGRRKYARLVDLDKQP